jgi:hypothetical protein
VTRTAQLGFRRYKMTQIHYVASIAWPSRNRGSGLSAGLRARTVTRSTESVTDVISVLAITWGFVDFYRPVLKTPQAEMALVIPRSPQSPDSNAPVDSLARISATLSTGPGPVLRPQPEGRKRSDRAGGAAHLACQMWVAQSSPSVPASSLN